MPERTELVHIKVSGPPAAVERISQWLHCGLDVRDASLDYPNRRNPGVRRYLTVLVAESGRREPR
jgi:hypothetical protein